MDPWFRLYGPSAGDRCRVVFLTRVGNQVTQLQAEADMLRRSSKDAATFRPLTLPADLAPSSAETISTLNEYAIRLLQVTSTYRILFVCSRL